MLTSLTVKIFVYLYTIKLLSRLFRRVQTTQKTNMRVTVLMKSFFYISIVSILLLVYKFLVDLKYAYNNKSVMESKYSNDVIYFLRNENNNVSNLKYILQWTSPKNVPFVYMGEGQEGFISRNCSYTNCFVTSNRTYLGDYTKFDVIAFAGPEVRFMQTPGYPDRLPEKRSQHQRYVFASIESAENYPVCSDKFNGFFNWTWTYRLESEAKWGYIVIRDAQNNIIGPKTNMNWLKTDQMDVVGDDIKEKLRKKTKAVAWFVSNCVSRSRREKFASVLGIWLAKYDLEIDIYGECGNLKCSRDNEEECDKMIERDYYFYLSFENSFAEDYVTEKLLHPLKYLAVPIVYGGANYSRYSSLLFFICKVYVIWGINRNKGSMLIFIALWIK